MNTAPSRIIAAAHIIASGALMYAGGLIANAQRVSFEAANWADVGIGFLVAGGLFLLIEYAMVWGASMREKEIAERAKQELARKNISP